MKLEFTLVLSAGMLTDKQCEDLYEAGCDDGTISTSQGVSYLLALAGVPRNASSFRCSSSRGTAAGGTTSIPKS